MARGDGLVAGLGAGFILVILLISAVIGGFLWPYSINSWLVFIGKPAKVVFWHGMILGILPWFGQLSIPVAIITWILMLFLV